MKSLLLSLSLVLTTSTLFAQIISTQRIAQADDVWKEDVYQGVEQLVQLRRISPFYFKADSIVAPILVKNNLPALLESLDSTYRQEIEQLKQWYFGKVLEEAYWNQGYRYIDAQLEFDKLHFYPLVYRVLLNPASGSMGLDRSSTAIAAFSDQLAGIRQALALLTVEELELVQNWASDWDTLTKKLQPRLLVGTPSSEQIEEQTLLNALLLWSRFQTK